MRRIEDKAQQCLHSFLRRNEGGKERRERRKFDELDKWRKEKKRKKTGKDKPLNACIEQRTVVQRLHITAFQSLMPFASFVAKGGFREPSFPFLCWRGDDEYHTTQLSLLFFVASFFQDLSVTERIQKYAGQHTGKQKKRKKIGTKKKTFLGSEVVVALS